jgi:hypothetical protein
MSKQQFLRNVGQIVPQSFKSIDFASIIDDLIVWSHSRSALSQAEPKKQNTVSYCLPGSGYVVWAAYPRKQDGAKVVVLPQVFRRLDSMVQRDFLGHLLRTAPNAKIAAGGMLQLPMHLLSGAKPMRTFL